MNPVDTTATTPATNSLEQIAQRYARLPAAQRSQFRQALAARGLALTELPVVRQPGRDSAALSAAQQRLWFLDQLEGPNAVYNICTAMRFDGPLDALALKAGFETLLRRHAGLRTAIVVNDGRAVQRVADDVTLPWREIDLCAVPQPQRDARVEALGLEMAGVRFDLSQPPLLSVMLARTAPHEHVLWITLHHIVADAWSLDLLMQELAALYAERCGGAPAGLRGLAIDAVDCALWQNELLQGDTLNDALAYWKRTLGDEHPLLALPADHARPAQQSHRGALHRFDLAPGLAEGLRTLARREGKTLFTLLMAAFHALLYRHTGQHDLRVGTPVAHRDRAETQGVVGLFLNTLVLRTEPVGALRFDELLAFVGRRLSEAQAHQHLPFEKVVEALQPARELSHAPLFQAMLIVHAAAAPVAWQGLTVHPHATPTTAAKFDLALEVADAGADGLHASFNYATDLFEPATIERLARHVTTLLRGIVADPQTRLDALPMLEPAERRQLLVGWNDTRFDHPQGAWVHELIARQAAETPDAPALFFGDEVLSYRRLDQRANKLAHELRSLGVRPDHVVGVCCLRSIDMVVALLAVMKAGGAYLPLDPDYPPERLQQMLDDAGASLLLTHRAVARLPGGARQRRLVLDDVWHDIVRQPAYAASVALQPGHLAYVIYTSGSTGRPKGVAVPHAGLLNRLQWMQHEYRLEPHDRVLQKTPFSFDVSVWEFFWPLMTGAALVVAGPGDHRDSERLAALIRRHGVTTLHFVPSMLRAFLEDPQAASCESLRRVICSGEALPLDLQQRFFSVSQAQLHNLYGPTEASIDVSAWACRREGGDTQVPIGRPIHNTRLHVLDEAMNPVPVGVAGELLIGGVALARGYLGRPDLTAERFIPDPYAPGERLYRTGDLARWRADGAIDYLGRLDHQVKVRGFRIELGEIETRLQAHPAVGQAVVLAREDRPGDKRLVAYWVADATAGVDRALPDDEALNAFLRETLPEHMLPAAWVRLEAMPLSTNGKLDRKALPAPSFAAAGGEDAAPRNAREQQLAEVWQEVLGLPQVGVHDNFFRLGGDSILSLQVVARARQRGLRLSPKQMFEHQTIAAAAAAAGVIEAPALQAAQEVDDEHSGIPAPLAPIQHWFFEAGFASPAHWNQAMVLVLRDAADARAVPAALQAVVQRHGALRLRFENGQRDGAWRQRYGAAGEAPLERIDLGELAEASWAEAIEHRGRVLQGRMDLSEGPLLQAALFSGAAGIRPRLLLAIHHLAVDGVSWRVLLGDLETACRQVREGHEIALPPVPTSYRRWAQRLQAHAQSQEALAELSHWLQAGGSAPAMSLGDPGTVGEAVRVQARLDAARTAALLADVPSRQRARIDDLLLAALAQTLCAALRQGAVLVELEGHGREDLFPELDVSRTVGWFTTRYPVRLAPGGADVDATGDVASRAVAALQAVKEQLRRVPRRGIGYGLLRYLGDAATQAQLTALPQPEVCFNYLGRFDRVFHGEAALALDDASPGPTRSPHERRTHAIDVDAQVQGDALCVEWTCAAGVQATLGPGAAEALAQSFIAHLAALIDALQAQPAGATPSDFPLCGLEQTELDALRLPWDEIEDLYPLAPMQHGLLLHTLLNPGSGMYLMQDRYRLQGEVDPDAFVRAWEQVVARHPVLRTSFHWQSEDRPLQAVHRHTPPPVLRDDWRALDAEAQRARLDELLARELHEGFDLSQPHLIRFRLIDLGDGRWYFTQSYHHILIDAWCFSLLMVDFFAHYRALLDGVAVVPRASLPYADFIAWLGRQDPDAARSYWQRRLQGFEQPTPLGIDKLPGSRLHSGVDDHAVQLDETETAALQAYAQQLQITVNTCTQAAWALLLSWYAGSNDVLFGITVAGRPTELDGVETSVGLFINTLPLRLQIDPAQPAAHWLAQVLASNVELRQYEQLSLAEVQALSPLGRGQSLFESLFVFENAPVDRSLDEWKLRWRIDEKNARTHTNYPLTVVIIPGERLTLQITCERERFDAAAIRRMLGHFKSLLLALMAQPQALVGTLARPSRAEAAQFAAWNDTGRGEAIPADIVPLFEQQVRRTPGAVAARCGERSVTYAELDRRAGHIGQALAAEGIGPDDVVVLHDTRGIDLLAMMLGVFKAGAAYLPLDLRHPAARLAEVIGISRTRLVLRGERSDAALDSALQLLGAQAPRCVRLSELSHDAPEMARGRAPRGGGRHLAYVIYTSGSTGVPKGAMVERRGMLNNLLQKHVQLGLTERDVVAQTASASFDVSVWQFLSGLLCGACIEIVPDDTAQDPHALQRHLVDRGVTVLECVPALLRGLLHESQDQPLPLRWLLPTGEALPPELARQWLLRHPGIPLLNVYGPAECADDVALHALRDAGEVRGAHLPIGRPVAHLRLHVVNRRLEPLPMGVPGELCIAGAGVGRGYLNDPLRTAAAFVPNPFGSEPGERLYRTGDLVRQRDDGVYEYLGRIDHQVKLRGHRIELGEIEARLAAQPHIDQAVALVREDRPGDQRLVAYVVAREAGQEIDADALKAALAQSLPAVMVPSAIVSLASWPLSPNGKIDRRQLPAPGWQAEDIEGHETPSDPLQARLAAIWTEVLGLDRVGTRQDFFALGGHSLLATQVVSRIRRHLGVELALRAVFDAPTIEQLATALASAQAAAPASQPTITGPITPRVANGLPSPLSYAQERMWFLSELEPASPLYNLPVVLQLDGELDVAALAQAFSLLQARHEVLRSRIVRGDAGPLQRVMPAGPVDLPLHDLSGLSLSECETEARRRAGEEARGPFDLLHEDPWRVQLLKLAGQRHWLLLTLHHIAADGWAMGVLMRELGTLYAGLAAGREPLLPALPLQYADVAAWQREALSGPHLQQLLDYWRRQLGGPHEALELPTDRPRPPVQAHRGASLDLDVDPQLMTGLRQQGQRHGATPFMTLLAAYATLLHRYSGQRDIRIGTPTANRQRVETEGVVGLFVNTLVLRCRFDDATDFPQLLRQVRETALGAQVHQDLPFEQLVEALQPERDLSRSPLFQALFILQNMPLAAPPLAGLSVTALPASHGTSKFDISLIAEEGEGGGLRASIEYDTDLFEATTIERMARHLVRILRHAAADAPGPVADWTLFDDEEHRQWLALVRPSADDADAGAPLCVVQSFEAQAARQPEAVALLLDGQGGPASLSYGELDRRATALGHRLRQAGLRPDGLVAVCLPRSASMVVALLAVLKAGGAYVPLDPNYPSDRLSWMLEDAQPRLLLTETALLPRLPAHGADVLCLDQPAHERGARLHGGAHPGHLAYCIYTSGSTGRPKGVQVTRAALGNLLGSMQQRLGVERGEMLLALTSLSFDIAALELYLPLVSGGTVLLADDAQTADAGELLRLLREQPVRTLQATPATWRMLLDAGWPGRQGEGAPLRLLCGGEALSADLAEALALRGDALWNVYGPTETTIWSTLHRVQPDGLPPPIGRPIARTDALVLDARLNPVPPGVAGELYLGGGGLARGYRGRPDLSAERFVPHPFAHGARLYRTGDLARQRTDGTLLCLGRGDRQIKLRGFRIELDEIESALSAAEGVRQAAVVAFGDADQREIVAYAVPDHPGRLTPQGLRDTLARSLPGYMVPAQVVLLDALSLTPNAKVDRKALPRPQPAAAGRYVAPANAAEALLANVWETLLGLPQIGVHDNFFHLGGHSLLAVRAMQRTRQLLGRELPLTLLFKAPTIAELASALHSGVPPASPVIALRSEGTRTPLFCVHPAGGHVASYLPLVQALPADQPVYGLQSRTLFDPQWQDRSIADMARDYTEAIRQIQPSGPYRLLGWSMGGLLALAMAALLERLGECVEFIGLLDTTRYQDEATAQRHDRAADYLDQLAGLCRVALAPAQRSALQRELSEVAPEAQLVHLLQWARAHAELKEEADLEQIELQVQAREGANRLMREHRVETIDAALHVWWAEQTLAAHGANGAPTDWRSATRAAVTDAIVPADHWSLLKAQALHVGVAEQLASSSCRASPITKTGGRMAT